MIFYKNIETNVYKGNIEGSYYFQYIERELSKTTIKHVVRIDLNCIENENLNVKDMVNNVFGSNDNIMIYPNVTSDEYYISDVHMTMEKNIINIERMERMCF